MSFDTRKEALCSWTIVNYKEDDEQRWAGVTLKEFGLCLLGKKAMINLDSMLKNRDITLLKKFHIAKL